MQVRVSLSSLLLCCLYGSCFVSLSVSASHAVVAASTTVTTTRRSTTTTTSTASVFATTTGINSRTGSGFGLSTAGNELSRAADEGGVVGRLKKMVDDDYHHDQLPKHRQQHVVVVEMMLAPSSPVRHTTSFESSACYRDMFHHSCRNEGKEEISDDGP